MKNKDEDSKDENNKNKEKQLISDDVNETVKQGYVIAVTEYFYTHRIEVGEIGTIKIYGNKVLSSSERGIDVRNHTEIIETNGTRSIKGSILGNYNPNLDPKKFGPHEQDDDMTSLVITPPTGLMDNKVLIISVLVISMIVLVGGICFIKKKIIE